MKVTNIFMIKIYDIEDSETSNYNEILGLKDSISYKHKIKKETKIQV